MQGSALHPPKDFLKKVLRNPKNFGKGAIGVPRGQVERLAHHHGALPIGVRGTWDSTVGTGGLLRFGHVRVLTTHRVVIHCAHAASLPRRSTFSITSGNPLST